MLRPPTLVPTPLGIENMRLRFNVHHWTYMHPSYLYYAQRPSHFYMSRVQNVLARRVHDLNFFTL